VDRYCIKEEYVETCGFYYGAVSLGYTVKEWTYTYNDGTTEVVTIREEDTE